MFDVDNNAYASYRDIVDIFVNVKEKKNEESWELFLLVVKKFCS